DARQQRVARHVAAGPELVGGHVLVAGDDVLRRIDVDDGGELFHLEALRVDAADGVLVGDDAAEVEAGRVQVQGGWHGKSLSPLSPCGRGVGGEGSAQKSPRANASALGTFAL